ncbi:hypothetical protein D3C76_1310590 [compost metagenome]
MGRPAAILAIWMALSPPARSSPAATPPSRTHQSNLIQLGGLVLPIAFSVQSTWVPASAVVTKCTASSRQTKIESAPPIKGPSSFPSRVNMAAVGSFLVASRIVPPSKVACS